MLDDEEEMDGEDSDDGGDTAVALVGDGAFAFSAATVADIDDAEVKSSVASLPSLLEAGLVVT